MPITGNLEGTGIAQRVEEAMRRTIIAAVTAHLREYRYDGMTAVVDRTRLVASRVGATITPEAAVVDRTGAIRYRGRIVGRCRLQRPSPSRIRSRRSSTRTA